MSEIAFDPCVISNFALAGAIGLIEELYRGKAHITEFVAAEVLRGIQSGHAGLEAIPKAVQAGWLKEIGMRSSEEKALFESFSRSLGLGEVSSLAAAKRRGLVFASDDRVARAEAVRLGVPLSGTLGILIRAVSDGVSDVHAADGYLKKMIEAGFFSPVRSLRGTPSDSL
jgi:predicted nucleic acid-binding protein